MKGVYSCTSEFGTPFKRDASNSLSPFHSTPKSPTTSQPPLPSTKLSQSAQHVQYHIGILPQSQIMALQSKHRPQRRLWCSLLLVTSSCLVNLPVSTTAWSTPPLANTKYTSSSLQQQPSPLASSTSSNVDQLYYSPTFSDRLDSAEDMETAAQKYGGNAGGGTKITLTRWLSAKVQDYPEVSCCDVIHCLLYFIVLEVPCSKYTSVHSTHLMCLHLHTQRLSYETWNPSISPYKWHAKQSPT